MTRRDRAAGALRPPQTTRDGHRLRTAVVIALSLMTLGAAACSASTTTATSNAPSTASGSATGSSAKPVTGRWAKILRLIPDTDETRREVTDASTFLNDFEVAASALGIQRPPADAPDAATNAYALALRDKAGILLAQGAAPAIGTVSQSFTLGDGQSLLAIENGRFDPAAVRPRVTEGMDPAPRVAEHEGDSFLLSQMCVSGCPRGKNKDKDKDSRPDSAFFIGPDTFLVAANPDLMKSALDARAGRKPSLADDPDIAAVASALDEEGTFAVALQLDRPKGATGTTAKKGASTTSSPTVGPYVMSGVGLAASDPKQLEVVVVLLATSDDAAAANVEKLRTYVAEGTDEKSGTPLADVVEVGSVRSEGRVTVARLKLKDSADPTWLRDALEAGTLPPPTAA